MPRSRSSNHHEERARIVTALETELARLDELGLDEVACHLSLAIEQLKLD